MDPITWFFDKHPEATEVHQTADGSLFAKKDLAQLHERSLVREGTNQGGITTHVAPATPAPLEEGDKPKPPKKTAKKK